MQERNKKNPERSIEVSGLTENRPAYSRLFAYDKRFEYLDTDDRYYLARPRVRAKIAVIGLGVNGRGHIANVLTEGRGEIGGIYDPHEPSVKAALRMHEEFAGTENVRVYSSLEDAVGDDAIDAYIIATPNYRHLEELRAVIGSGKPVFLEKPMASTVEDAWAIRNLVREHNALVHVGLQYRFKSMYVEAINELLTLRSIGTLRTLSITEHRIPFLDKVGQWNKFSTYSGGTLVEKCCHYFDLFNLFAGVKPVRVIGSGSQAVNYEDFDYHGVEADILDNASVIVEYENGIRATFDLCMFAPMFFEELVVCGDGGRFRTYEQEDFTGSDSFRSSVEVYRGERGPTRIGEPKYPYAIRELGHSGADFFAQSKFVDFIIDNSTEVPGVEEGFWSVVVGAAAEEAVRTGMPVDVDAFMKQHGVV